MSGLSIQVHHQINVRDVLERAGLDDQAPEDTQAWALAQVALAFDRIDAVLREFEGMTGSGYQYMAANVRAAYDRTGGAA